MADEAAPPERGVELNERPQLRVVAPHPREQNRDAPRLPRRRGSRRPVETPAATGPHGLRRPGPCSTASVEGTEEKGNRSKGLCCFTCLFWWEMEEEMEETGTGWVASAFGSSRIFIFLFEGFSSKTPFF